MKMPKIKDYTHKNGERMQYAWEKFRPHRIKQAWRCQWNTHDFKVQQSFFPSLPFMYTKTSDSELQDSVRLPECHDPSPQCYTRAHQPSNICTSAWTIGRQASNDQGKWTGKVRTVLGPSWGGPASIQAFGELTHSSQPCSLSKWPAWHGVPFGHNIFQWVPWPHTS